MKYEVLCPRPAHRSFTDSSGYILGLKLCIGATILCPNFFHFILLYMYSFFYLFFWFFFSYPSLLIYSSSSHTILRLLILFFLHVYFKLFVVLQTCILIVSQLWCEHLYRLLYSSRDTEKGGRRGKRHPTDKHE
jgi:hypothetical protein